MKVAKFGFTSISRKMSSSDCSQHEEDKLRVKPKDSYIRPVDYLESEEAFSPLSSKEYRECGYAREEVKTPPTAPQTPSAQESGKHSLRESSWKALGAVDIFNSCPFEANFTLSSTVSQTNGQVDTAVKADSTAEVKKPENAGEAQEILEKDVQYLSVLSSGEHEQRNIQVYMHDGHRTKVKDRNISSGSGAEEDNYVSVPSAPCFNVTLQSKTNSSKSNSVLYLSTLPKGDHTPQPVGMRYKASNNLKEPGETTEFGLTIQHAGGPSTSEPAPKFLDETPRDQSLQHTSGRNLGDLEGRGISDMLNISHCSDTFVRNYLERRASFERNCFLRYEAYLEKTNEKIRRVGGSFEGRRLMRNECEDSEEGRIPFKATTTAGRRPKRGGGYYSSRVDPSHSSSGEDGSTRGAGDGGDNSVCGAEGDVGIQEGSPRKMKSGPQRSFPYRHFHIHHMLPEPENKVGLLTHPTPAQFNKYPKARGVWFDPHRNLVRTCWKENGKARTMGFPVNKFGLEEARTLAVEYHFYKCPTDPLPEDLCTLVPRKPPHEYGWC